MTKGLSRILAAALCAGLSVGTLFAQSSSGTISGRVLDTTGQAVPGATVTLLRTDTREVRALVTSTTGDVVFTSLQPGPYTLQVEMDGFNKLEKTNLVLSSSERLSVGDLVLKLGAVSETVYVEAERAPIQTESSERGALIDSTQITELPTRGRDVFGLLPTLPGVVYDGRGGDGIGTAGSPDAFSGTRGMYSGANIDGISGNVRSGDSLDTTLAMDTVAEVKVLLNNYQAEYGKAAAGLINIVTKSGSQDLHGTAYYYARNEHLNANTFFRNAAGTERGRYRYNTVGATLGGPLTIPGVFNKDKSNLFFFGAYEYRPSTVPQSTRYYTVPTLAERNGDFNRSVGSANGALYSPSRIIDPLTGKAFPNGIVPANRIDPNMQKLLNIFPLPNAPDVVNGGALSPSGNWYNYSITDSLERPGWQGTLRLDYNISDKWHAFFRASNYGTHNKGSNSTVNRVPWMPDADVDYALDSRNWGGTATWIASPTVVNEFIFGYARWGENQFYRDEWLAKLQNDALGVDLPQFFPDQNKLNVIPALNFGSTNIGPDAATVRWEGRFPMENIADSWTLSDNVTKVWRNHQFKGGVAFE
jgi:hypothetical protein